MEVAKNVLVRLLVLALLILQGCAGEPFRFDPPQDHPANPAAPEAPVPPPSSALDEGVPEPAHEEAAPPSGEHMRDGQGMEHHHQ